MKDLRAPARHLGRLVLLVALCVLAYAPTSLAQGFGYAPALPDQATVRIRSRAFLYGYPTNPDISFQATTDRDSAGVAAGSSVLFKFDEARARLNNFNTTADVMGICTDYVTSSDLCVSGWQNASASDDSRVVVFPSLSSGADVVSKTMAIKIQDRKYNSIGQYISTTTGTVSTSYFLVPPPDHFFRDASGNEVAIWRQRAISTGGALNRPLLIAEGVDISDRSEPDEYFGQLGALAKVLRSGGYDVAVVSFGQPLESVRLHEAGFRNAVQLAHQMKADSAIPSVVMGLSRGGVVARYALARMEEMGVAHNTSLFISYDSPQRGANINSNLMNYLFNLFVTPSSLQAVVDQLRSDAVIELLQEHPDNASSGYNMHQSLYGDINALNGGFGYPQNLRRVSWSNGSWSVPQFSSELFLNVNYETSGLDTDVALTNLDRQPGSFLPQQFQGLIDGKEGNVAQGSAAAAALILVGGALFKTLTLSSQNFGGYYRVRAYSMPTFIPTSSALDQDGPRATSRFDRVWHSTVRRSHAAVPREAVDFILQELGLLPPLTASIAGPSQVAPGATGYWSIPNSQPWGGLSPYTWRWAYHYECPSTCTGNTCISPAPMSAPVDPEPAEACGVWHNGGNYRGFTKTMPSAYLGMMVRLTVTDATPATRQYLRAVSISQYRPAGDSTTTADGTLAGRAGASVVETAGGASASLGAGLPAAYALHAVAPNPSSGSATVRFDVPEASAVTITVVDALGREVARVADGWREAGSHAAAFDGRSLPPGVYVVRLRAGAFAAARTWTRTR